MTKEEILDAISNLIVIGSQSASDAFEERFEVTASPPRWPWPLLAPLRAAEQIGRRSKTNLTSSCSMPALKKIHIKVVRETTSLASKRPRISWTAPRKPVAQKANKEAAEAAGLLVEAGATVEVK